MWHDMDFVVAVAGSPTATQTQPRFQPSWPARGSRLADFKAVG
jgi:hypothetical protein